LNGCILRLFIKKIHPEDIELFYKLLDIIRKNKNENKHAHIGINILYEKVNLTGNKELRDKFYKYYRDITHSAPPLYLSKPKITTRKWKPRSKEEPKVKGEPEVRRDDSSRGRGRGRGRAARESAKWVVKKNRTVNKDKLKTFVKICENLIKV
jgi:hypothetical protein